MTFSFAWQFAGQTHPGEGFVFFCRGLSFVYLENLFELSSSMMALQAVVTSIFMGAFKTKSPLLLPRTLSMVRMKVRLVLRWCPGGGFERSRQHF